MSTKEMFVRKHITVEAIQYTGKNFFDVQTFINGRKPETKSNYAAQKWEEYCQKCEQDGYLEVPASLGYDPTYSRCNPTDYIVSPQPGVYTVMSKESFEEQYAPMTGNPSWRREDIADVSGVNALAEGYGPLKVPEGEIPSEVIEWATDRSRSRQDHFPIGVNATEVQRPP